MTRRRPFDFKDFDAARRARIIEVVREFRGQTAGETVAKMAGEIRSLRSRLSMVEEVSQGKVGGLITYGPHGDTNAKAALRRDRQAKFFLSVSKRVGR
jgi:hypothetical protein